MSRRPWRWSPTGAHAPATLRRGPRRGRLGLDSARAGLARILANAPNASIEPYAPLGPCPLVDRATVNGELADAGIDAPLGDWTRLAYADGPHTDVLLACEGTYIGVDEDPSFPELRFDVVAIDLGDAATAERVLRDEFAATGEPLRITDLDGGTIGECGDEDLAVRCAEWWQHDGFVVGVEIVDRVFVDRPTASTVLGGVVPAIVSTLGAAASDIADPLRTIGAADAGRALDALDAFVDANPEAVSSEHERIDCPLIDSESLRPALDDAGIDWPLGGWAASISPVTFPRDLDPVPQRVSCTNRSGSVTVDAIAFGDDGQAADFVASVGGAEGGSASDLAPGDLTVGSCTERERRQVLQRVVARRRPRARRDAVQRPVRPGSRSDRRRRRGQHPRDDRPRGAHHPRPVNDRWAPA